MNAPLYHLRCSSLNEARTPVRLVPSGLRRAAFFLGWIV